MLQLLAGTDAGKRLGWFVSSVIVRNKRFSISLSSNTILIFFGVYKVFYSFYSLRIGL